MTVSNQISTLKIEQLPLDDPVACNSNDIRVFAYADVGQAADLRNFHW